MKKQVMFVTFCLAVCSTLVFGNSGNWQYLKCEGNANCAPTHYKDVLRMKKTGAVEPGRKYVAASFIASDNKELFDVSVHGRGANILRVYDENVSVGKTRRGDFTITLDSAPRLISVSFIAQSDAPEIYLKSRRRKDRRAIRFQRNLYRAPRQVLTFSVKRAKEGNAVFKGSVKEPAVVHVNSVLLGDVAGSFQGMVSLDGNNEVVVHAENFYSSVSKTVALTVADSLAEVAGNNDGEPAPRPFYRSVKHELWQQSSENMFTAYLSQRAMNKAVRFVTTSQENKKTASSASSASSASLRLSSDVFYLDENKGFSVDGEFNYSSDYTIYMNNENLAKGSGQTFHLNIMPSYVPNPTGLNTITVRAGALTKSKRFFAVSADSLTVTWSKPVLFSDRQDSVTVVPHLDGYDFFYALYDQDWFLVASDSLKDSLVWYGKNTDSADVIDGIYYCVVTALDTSRADTTITPKPAQNAIQSILVAPADFFPSARIDLAEGRDTVYLNDTTAVLTYDINGHEVQDTIDPRIDTVVINRVSIYGDTAADTSVIVFDTIAPVFTVTNTNLVNDTIFTRDSSVTITYTVDGKDIQIDTVLSEGVHDFVFVEVDSAGNVGVDTLQVFVYLQPPYPVITVPEPAKLTTTFTPLLHVNYSENLAAIDTSTLVIKLDSVDVTDSFTVTETGARWQLDSATALANGHHNLWVSIANDEDNVSVKSYNFIVSRVVSQPSVYPDSGTVPMTVTFQTKAIDPTGTVEAYLWDFNGDGIVDSAFQVPPSVTYEYLVPGVYTPTLTVISNTGQIDTAQLRIVCTPPEPRAWVSVKPNNGGVPLVAGFTGGGTSDGGYIKLHKYDFDGDGSYDTTILASKDTVDLLTATFDSGLDGFTSGGSTGSFGVKTRPSDAGSVWSVRDYRAITGGTNIQNFNQTISVTNVNLLSTVIALPADTVLHLSFDQYINSSSYSYVEIDTTADDTLWHRLAIMRSYDNGDSTVRIDIGDYAGTDAQIRFRYTGTISNTKREGWDLDNILIYSGDADSADTILYDPADGSVDWIGTDNARGWNRTTPISVPEYLAGAWIEVDTSGYEYGENFDTWITSPSVDLTTGLNSYLTFRHTMQVGNHEDGGVVQVSVDNGSFTTIQPMDTVNVDSLSDMGLGFTDTILSAVDVFDLSSYNGSSVAVRFRFYSDDTLSGRGWLIDSVRIFEIKDALIADTTILHATDWDSGLDGWTTGSEGSSSQELLHELRSRASNSDTAWSSYRDTLDRYSASNISLTLPQFTIPAAQTCTLSYWGYLRGGYGYTQIDTGNGSFTNVHYYSSFKGDSSMFIDLSTYAGKTVTLRFQYSGYAGGTARYGWTIDDIAIVATDTVSAVSTTLFSSTGDGSAGMLVDTVSGNSWVRKPRYLMGTGAGWLELAPDSTRHGDSLDTWVESPFMYVNGSRLELSFTSYFTSTYRRAGGFVEVRRKGAPYEVIYPDNRNVSTPLYQSVPPYATNPYALTSDLSYDTMVYNISKFTGSEIQVRFRFVSDTVAANGEWILDDFEIADVTRSSHITHTYNSEGTVDAVFQVTDNYGGTAVASSHLSQVRVGPAGTPSAYAFADTTYGPAPLQVEFSGWGYDPTDSIVSYEWDFNGDGTFDTVVNSEMTITHTYDTVGIYYPVFRVTDNSGSSASTSKDILRIEATFNPSISVTETDKTFSPVDGETVGFKTIVNGTVHMRVIVVDTAGDLVTELVPWETRDNGTYTDNWSGRDSSAEIAMAGLYFAVLEYIYNGDTLELDLSRTTGGIQYELGQARSATGFFKPLDDSLHAVNFTLDKAYYVTVFAGYQSLNQRVRTLYEKVLFPAGAHVVYWDGLNDAGKITPKASSGSTVIAGWKYSLADNAVLLTAPRPEISFVGATPNYVSPLSQSCPPEPNGFSLSYTLNMDVARVEALVIDTKTTAVVGTIVQDSVQAGENSLSWDGTIGDDEIYADAGIYRFGVRATTAAGERSLFRYTLVRIAP